MSVQMIILLEKRMYESCEINVKRKFKVIHDLIIPLDFNIRHTIIKPNSHKESCDSKEIKANPNTVFDSN
jgi:hypothetical protein